MIVYLSKAQVLYIHQRQLERFGGIGGLRDEAGLDAALARSMATFDGEDLYPTPWEKAAALLHSLVANHPFLDGNKRTAALCAELFLLVNGLEIQATDEDFDELVMATARGEREAQEIAIWLEQRLGDLR